MSPTLHVFRKEIREILRDKRVRNAATLMPLFIVFLLMSLFGVIGASRARVRSRRSTS